MASACTPARGASPRHSRIEHVIHLELQWTVWTPLTLWALIPGFRYRDWSGGDTQIFKLRR